MGSRTYNQCKFFYYGKRRPGLRITLAFGQLAITGDWKMDVVMTVTQMTKATLSPVDSRGNPAAVENVAWAVSDDTRLRIEPGDGGMSCVITALGPTGNAQVTVTADADLGEGVAELTGVINFDLKPAQAISLGINVATPTEQSPL